MQNHYNVVYREEEREMFPTLKVSLARLYLVLRFTIDTRTLYKMLGVGSIPWSPLARGFLCRPIGEQTKRGDTDK